MKLYCAIDIRGGRCVRLYQGDYAAEKVYDEDPVARAVQMQADGADWIHVVDLDGARTGRPENASVVAAIADAVSVPVQAGGGVRDTDTALAWFAAGVQRVVIGTAAVRDPDMTRQLARSHPLAVGLDARSGDIATDGWRHASGQSVLDVATDFVGSGVEAFVVTEISRDGTLDGPDLVGLSEMLAATQVDVVASGGVGALSDLSALAALRDATGRALSGVIVGTALYEGRFSVAEAAAEISGTR